MTKAKKDLKPLEEKKTLKADEAESIRGGVRKETQTTAVKDTANVHKLL